MPSWIWMLVNGLIGVPLALVGLVFLRELLRAVLALALGFRVFALQWGAGPPRLEGPVGPVDLGLAPWPIAGSTVARSGAARRHRAGRFLLATGPLLAQTIWLLVRLYDGTPPGTAPLFEGPAPIACFDLANTLLLVLHATLAVELSPGVRTDVRLLLDAFLGRAESDRAARANYYARLARHRLERADVDGTHAALATGITQLGPEPLLVAARDRLAQSELDSVVDQGDCCDALHALVEQAEPRRRVERADWSFGERLRQAGWSALPLTAAIAALVFVQAERMARSAERGMLAVAARAIAAEEVDGCARMIDRLHEWSARIDPWLPPSAADLSDRSLAISRLERCRGDALAADRHRDEALLAASGANRNASVALGDDPLRWLSNELRVTVLLREAAMRETGRSAFRQALTALGQADRRLDALDGQLGLLPGGSVRADASRQLGEERLAVRSLREQVLVRMAAPAP